MKALSRRKHATHSVLSKTATEFRRDTFLAYVPNVLLAMTSIDEQRITCMHLDMIRKHFILTFVSLAAWFYLYLPLILCMEL
jgi:hypothetical protein